MNISSEEEQLRKEIAEEEVDDEVILLSEASRRKEKDTNFERFKTGIPMFDGHAKLRETDQGGIGFGDLMIISAPTGNGKTTLAATISYNMLKEGISSLWFTYEVSEYQLWKTFECMGANKEDMLYVPANHTTGEVSWVEKKIQEAKKKESLTKCVIIDHLGFLVPAQKMNQNMTQNYSSYLGQICRELKTIAVRENVMIILPVHMVKSSGDDPSMRDIAHSGGIAQEADFVLLMAREEAGKAGKTDSYYTEYTKVTLAKNRPGGTTPSWYMKKEGGRLVTTDHESKNIWEKKQRPLY